MSLLLFYQTTAAAIPVFCWGKTTSPTAAWAGVNIDYKDEWVDWQTYTWGQILDSGYTWHYMSGFTFRRITKGTATWTTVPKATQNCP